MIICFIRGYKLHQTLVCFANCFKSLPIVEINKFYYWIHVSYLYHMVSLLLLSRFSHVQLCVTPQTAAHQAPLSPGFSRQEHWSGLPFPSPMHESEKWKWSCSVLSDSSDPMDCSPPGSSVHGIFQAKVLEWGAIAFSGNVPLVSLIFLKISLVFPIILFFSLFLCIVHLGRLSISPC